MASIVMTVFAIGCTSPPVAHHPAPMSAAAIDRVLAPQVTGGFQSDVMILGTLHLAEYRDELRAEHLANLLARLEAFAPTRIAVETLTPDEIALLMARAAQDSAAAQILDMFARRTADAGRAMQQHLGVGRVEAERRARALIDRGPATGRERIDAVAHLLAAYDYETATLQWSYLSASERSAAAAIPVDIRERLDRRLAPSNEVVTIALPLARRLGLQRIDAIDSQYDGVRTLAVPMPALMELFSDSARTRLRHPEFSRRTDSLRVAGFAGGDLLPLFRYLNSDEHDRVDLTQWNWLFARRHPTGLDRFRYAMWEARNMRQATNVLDVAASGPPERVLVIVGASHKPYLDRILATQLTVRLVPFGGTGDRPSTTTPSAGASRR